MHPSHERRRSRRFVLNATLPRIFQRRILRMLPPELGRYLLDAGRGFSSHGEIGASQRGRDEGIYFFGAFLPQGASLVLRRPMLGGRGAHLHVSAERAIAVMLTALF